MRLALLTALSLTLSVNAAYAQSTDPNQTCADYLKTEAAAGPTPKTGDAATDKMAADLDAKMTAYCTANPKATVTEAATKAIGN